MKSRRTYMMYVVVSTNKHHESDLYGIAEKEVLLSWL